MINLELLNFETYSFGGKARVRCRTCKKTYRRSGYYLNDHFDEHKKKGEYMQEYTQMDKPIIVKELINLEPGKVGRKLSEEDWLLLKKLVDGKTPSEVAILARERKRSENTLRRIKKSISYEDYLALVREDLRRQNGYKENGVVNPTYKINEEFFKKVKGLLFTGMNDTEVGKATGISNVTVGIIRRAGSIEEYRLLRKGQKPETTTSRADANRYARLRDMSERVISDFANIFIDEVEILRRIVEKENGEKLRSLEIENIKLQKRIEELENRNDALQQKIEELRRPDITRVIQERLESKRLLTQPQTETTSNSKEDEAQLDKATGGNQLLEE